MSAPGTGSIRLRLFFDYPPPAVVSCRKCWLLVDLNTCRVVSDLESVIRDRFEFSRGSILSLFVEDCYLPHTESIYVVRDNDSVRVKVDCLTQANGHSSCPETTRETCRKRPKTTEEDGPAEKGVDVGWKKKKRKERSEETTEEVTKLVSDDDRDNKKLQKKHTKKKKKKVEKSNPTVNPIPAATPKKTPTGLNKPAKSTKRPPAAKAKTHKPSSSDSSSSSEEDEAPRNTKIPSSSTSTAAKTPPNSKPAQKKPRPPPSSSSETDSSSSDEEPNVKTKPLTALSIKPQPAPSVLQATDCEQKQAGGPPQDSDSEEDIQLIIRKPLLPSGFGVGSQTPGRGRGRGQGRRGGGGERGRGGGIGWPRGSFGYKYNGAKEMSYETDLLSNVSVVLQNGVQDAPKQDYSSMPLLAAPPQVGQKIAFKLLELTENYTPEVSEYKEGKIVSFDPTTKQIELELLNSSQAPVEPGKFDLVYQNPDGSESVEYAVSRGSWVTERWESLLEPRLIV
ncbi:coilin [Acanthochromis polyacanthus]|uniref:Coilin p80 n=1 Tax=Acanthochromis polyacanthus TaxID=80966 RepID=A0A3Q1EPY6_9TELE|nr:coilin [Acanthochromis polyacanthus]